VTGVQTCALPISDDAHVITVDHGGTVTEFPDDLPADRLGLIAWLAAAVR